MEDSGDVTVTRPVCMDDAREMLSEVQHTHVILYTVSARCTPIVSYYLITKNKLPLKVLMVWLAPYVFVAPFVSIISGCMSMEFSYEYNPSTGLLDHTHTWYLDDPPTNQTQFCCTADYPNTSWQQAEDFLLALG